MHEIQHTRGQYFELTAQVEAKVKCLLKYEKGSQMPNYTWRELCFQF